MNDWRPGSSPYKLRAPSPRDEVDGWAVVAFNGYFIGSYWRVGSKSKGAHPKRPKGAKSQGCQEGAR